MASMWLCNNSGGYIRNLTLVEPRDGVPSKAERSGNVNGGMVIMLCNLELIDLLVSGSLGHDGALEADCPYKKIMKPHRLFAISTFYNSPSITISLFRCIFGYRERAEHYQIAWNGFIKDLDAAVQREFGKTHTWAPTYLHSRVSERSSVSQSDEAIYPELLTSVTVDYFALRNQGHCSCDEQKIPTI